MPIGDLGVVVGDPRQVSRWPRERGCNANGDGIGDKGKHDRDRRGCHARGARCRAAVGGNHIDVFGDQFCSKSGKSFELVVGKTSFEHDVTALDISELRQILSKGVEDRIWIAFPVEKRTDPVNSANLLRVRHAAGQSQSYC